MPMISCCKASIDCVMVHLNIVPWNKGYNLFNIGSASGARPLDLVMLYVIESWLPEIFYNK